MSNISQLIDMYTPTSITYKTR